MPDLKWLIRPIAHRGLHDAASGIIENTASAFQAALDAGYAIETDVQVSADGEAMVFHDALLDRLTSARGAVATRSAAELGRIPFTGTSDRMQTLPELLDQVAGRVPLVIEIKSNWENQGPLERRIAEHLSQYDGPAALMSFDPLSVAAFSSAAPQAPRGLVAERFDDPRYWSRFSALRRFSMRHLANAFIAKPHFIAYDIRALPAMAPLAARHLCRLPLLTWTVRTQAERSRAKRWADAMIFEGFRP